MVVSVPVVWNLGHIRAPNHGVWLATLLNLGLELHLGHWYCRPHSALVCVGWVCPPCPHLGRKGACLLGYKFAMFILLKNNLEKVVSCQSEAITTYA